MFSVLMIPLHRQKINTQFSDFVQKSYSKPNRRLSKKRMNSVMITHKLAECNHRVRSTHRLRSNHRSQSSIAKELIFRLHFSYKNTDRSHTREFYNKSMKNLLL